MEDAHFYVESDQAILAGVFDGHGGREVAAFASEQFQVKFPKALDLAKGNVHQAFETVLHEIHQDVVRRPAWNKVGSTAVISYIDKEENKIYTATLGDSEANIYRKVGRSLKSIPLSCVRDWVSTKDHSRLEKVHGKEAVEKQYQRAHFQAKGLRSQLDTGVNVSRAIGDVDQTGTPDRPLVIHKPTITVSELCPKDVIVLACDGLKDYVSEDKIVGDLSPGWLSSVRGKNIAQLLVNKALQQNTRDNVTVLSIEVS